MHIHLLVVEDDPNDVLLLKRALDDVGVECDISFARDGDEAIAYLSGQSAGTARPTHMLLDLKLPRRSGLELLEWVRNRADLKSLPIVVVTSSREDADVKHAHRMGIDLFRVKPIDFSAMVEMVREIAARWKLLAA